MAEPLKEMYNGKFIKEFSNTLQLFVPEFSPEKFEKKIFIPDWKSKELKARMRHITLTMHEFFPEKYTHRAKLLKQVASHTLDNRYAMSFTYMILPDYVECFGLEDLETSLDALEEITKLSSAEFAVRPFLIRYPEQMLAQMKKWSLHEHPMVRRLASEGSRPRLPWAMKVPHLIENPTAILPILENLKNDPDEIVRRSVANNLNDISKDYPEIVLRIAREWSGKNEETDKLIKHACRTLLKKGESNALKIFGLKFSESIKCSALKLSSEKIKNGKDIQLNFKLTNSGKKPEKIRLEYAVYFNRANGSLFKKVFKISETLLAAGASVTYSKKHSFKKITTRTYYPGKHLISIIVNGKEVQKKSFMLTK